MDLIKPDGLSLTNLETFNLMVGRNGSGKSRMLRDLNQYFRNRPPYSCLFQHNANVETNLNSGRDNEFVWRNKNQAQSFKETSFLKLKKLKEAFSDKIQTDLELRADFSKTFSSVYLNDLNSLLINVQISYDRGQMSIRTIDGEEVEPDQLSSGETEAITLAAEIMSHLEHLTADKTNIIVIDEPEAHMHPDMQVKLVKFINKRFLLLSPDVQTNTHFIISSHSTSLLGAFLEFPDARLAVKTFGNELINFSAASDVLRDTVPFFAHPLSSVFNLETPLVVEGEDDERIWQQVARSKRGDFKYFPCIATSVNVQSDLETFLQEFLPAFYDTPRAVSIRDGDNLDTPMTHLDFVRRFKLKCYEAENLLLTNEVLESLGTSWDDFKARAHGWVEGEGSRHPSKDLVAGLIADENRHRHVKIKSIRNVILGICNSNKPWEIAVGQRIANLTESSEDVHSIYNYLGGDLCQELGLMHN